MKIKNVVCRLKAASLVVFAVSFLIVSEAALSNDHETYLWLPQQSGQAQPFVSERWHSLLRESEVLHNDGARMIVRTADGDFLLSTVDHNGVRSIFSLCDWLPTWVCPFKSQPHEIPFQ